MCGNLEGDLLVDPGVFGQVDAAEAAAAEGRQDAVLPDGLTAEEHAASIRREYYQARGGCIIAGCTRGSMRPMPSASGDVVALPDDEAQHLTRVLRLKAGAAVRVFNGRGARVRRGRRARWRKTARRCASAPRARPCAEARVAVTLAQAVLKGDKMDDVVRDAVMMGVAAIQPIVTARSEVTLRSLAARPPAGALAADRRLVGQAVRPRGGAGDPRAARVRDRRRVARRHDAAGPGLMFVEPSASADALSLGDLDGRPPRETTVLVGPEGGWTPEEIEQGAAVSRPVTLGGRTLRADAMPVVALTALFTRWGEF